MFLENMRDQTVLLPPVRRKRGATLAIVVGLARSLELAGQRTEVYGRATRNERVVRGLVVCIVVFVDLHVILVVARAPGSLERVCNVGTVYVHNRQTALARRAAVRTFVQSFRGHHTRNIQPQKV